MHHPCWSSPRPRRCRSLWSRLERRSNELLREADTLRLQKVTSPDSAEQIDKQIKMLENKLTALSTGGTGTMGSFDDNMISYLGT